MAVVFKSPAKYVQGQGVIHELGHYTSELGQKGFVITSEGGYRRHGADIIKSFEEAGATITFEEFGGECSKNEISRIVKIAMLNPFDVVVGIGGGKVMDTAKAVALELDVPVVICPTIASSDAPTSAVSVIYTEEGAVDDCIFMPNNPDLIIVDTEIVAKSPLRMTIAGIGDALATYFEVRACLESGSDNCAGGKQSIAAVGIARLCYDTLMANGIQAKDDITNGLCTPAVEAVIEANTLLSGLGFESGGLSCAHAVHNGLTILDETHGMYHGEKVNFGTFVQLVIEQRDPEEIENVLKWMVAIGLPVTLNQLGIEDKSREHLYPVAEAVCQDMMIGHMTTKADPELIFKAFIEADELGMSALYV